MIQKLKSDYRKKKKEIEKRMKDFSKVKDENIFYELCFCLLTPQSKAKNADIIVKELKNKKFLEKKLNPKKLLQKNIRFHNNKTKYLLEAKSKFKSGLNLERSWLVKNIKGFGNKESAHFLRNIGFKDNAILDRHILLNLKEYKVIKEIPKTLSNKKYQEIEDKFKKFSKKVNIPLDHLDLLFWSKQTGEIFK